MYNVSMYLCMNKRIVRRIHVWKRRIYLRGKDSIDFAASFACCTGEVDLVFAAIGIAMLADLY